MASAVELSTTQTLSGTEASGSPCSNATRYSFWISSRTSRPASWASPSITAEPRTNPLVARRSTSSTLPLTSRKAPTVRARTSKRSPSPRARALPMRMASETEPGTVAARACATVRL